MTIIARLSKRCRLLSYTQVKYRLIILLGLCLVFEHSILKSLDVSINHLKWGMDFSNSSDPAEMPPDVRSLMGNSNGTIRYWDGTQTGIVKFSAYVASSLCHPITGIISDIHGGKLLVTTGILLNVVGLAAFPHIITLMPWWATTFATFLFGMAECMIVTPMYCFIAYWISKHELTNLSSSVHCGIFIAMMASVQTITIEGKRGEVEHISSWTHLQIILCSFGVVLYLLMLFNTFSSPALHPRLKNKAKVMTELIASNKFPKKVPWKVVLRDEGVRSVYFGIIAHKWMLFVLLFHFHSFRDESKTYLQNWIVKLPFAFGIAGVLASGFIEKRIIKARKIPVIYVRGFSIFMGTIMCSLTGIIQTYLTNIYLNVAMRCLSGYFLGLGFCGSEINVHDLTRHYSGTVMGVANSISDVLQFLYILSSPGSHCQTPKEAWLKELWLSLFVCLSFAILSAIYIHSEKATWDVIIEEEEELYEDD